jgi:hypothetical protein
MDKRLIIGDSLGAEVHSAAGIDLGSNNFLITDHPHPFVVVTAIVLLLLVIYYLYVGFIKSSFTGDWACIEREYGKISIDHNTVVDHCVAKIRGMCPRTFHGHVAGNSIYLKVGDEMIAGVVHDNQIYWNNGETWKRVNAMI